MASIAYGGNFWTLTPQYSLALQSSFLMVRSPRKDFGMCFSLIFFPPLRWKLVKARWFFVDFAAEIHEKRGPWYRRSDHGDWLSTCLAMSCYPHCSSPNSMGLFLGLMGWFSQSTSDKKYLISATSSTPTFIVLFQHLDKHIIYTSF